MTDALPLKNPFPPAHSAIGWRGCATPYGATAARTSPAEHASGCCVSSYFIPIRPKDAAARVRIPSDKLIRAAGQPPGHAMMAYESNGLCPMLDAANHCRIYDVRPQTCRDYDCRIFAAAGLEAGPAKPVINRRIRAWRFSYPTAADDAAHRAVRAAAEFIQTKRENFPGDRAPTAPTGIAVLAIKSYDVFLDAGALLTRR